MILVKDNLLTRLFAKGAASSLNSLYTTLWNNTPIANYANFGDTFSNAFLSSDLVYSIITKKAQAGSRAPFGVYKVKSISSAKKYKEYLSQKNIRKDVLLQLKEDAITPTGHYLNEKYASPNNNTSASEYTEILLMLLNLTGNVFEYAFKEDNSKEILQFHWLPSDLTQIKSDGMFPHGISGYQILMGDVKSFAPSEIIHTKYANIRWDISGSHLYGLSPVQAAWNLIQGDTESNKSQAETLKNRGARRLVSVQSNKIQNYAEGKAVMDGMREEFREQNIKHRDTILPVFADLKVFDVGLSAKDMELLAQWQPTFDRLCNVWHVPVEWFNSTKQSKYNNLEQYNKQAIINGVLPDLVKIRDSRNRWARANNIIKESEIIDFDPSVFNELEVDKHQMMNWLKDAPYTENEKRVFLGDNPILIEGMDMVYINRNKVGVNQMQNILNSNNNGQGQEANTGGNQVGEGNQGQSN